jgi:hypothetical protein
MTTCIMCGKPFDPEFDREQFLLEHGDKNYDYFKGPHCFECAHEVIDEGLEGHYLEFCDDCGKQFDFYSDNIYFMDVARPYSNADLPTIQSYYRKILCSDCALNLMEREFPNGGGF